MWDVGLEPHDLTVREPAVRRRSLSHRRDGFPSSAAVSVLDGDAGRLALIRRKRAANRGVIVASGKQRECAGVARPDDREMPPVQRGELGHPPRRSATATTVASVVPSGRSE